MVQTIHCITSLTEFRFRATSMWEEAVYQIKEQVLDSDSFIVAVD